MAIHKIKQGALRPSVEIQAKNLDGTVFSLVGYTSPTFSMRGPFPTRPGTLKVDDVAATISDAANGKVKYDFAGTDTDTAGLYETEWHALDPSLDKIKLPTGENVEVLVQGAVKP